MLRRSDRTLKWFFPYVRLDGVLASGQAKTMKTGWTGLWLCPVSGDRTCPVKTREVLDLSGVDRTLGGSVRSLPSECLVNSSRAGFQLFSISFSITGGPPLITAAAS